MGANQPILDLSYDGQFGVGREYWGISGPRDPVGTFYWSSLENVRYLHEALYDNGVFVDVEILSRVAINADGRSVLGTATRHLPDGSSSRECFIARFSEPIDSTPATKIADVPQDPVPARLLSAGGRTSCVRDADGSVRCWGAGIAAMMGRSANDGWSALDAIPLAGALQVSLANDHGCAVLSDHSVRCWGDNRSGQLGDGTLLASAVPVEVLGIDDATAVAVGDGASCALRQGGSVQCWGSNLLGVLAQDFETLASSPTPVTVANLPPARAISVASWGACAVVEGGNTWCWGFSFSLDSINSPAVLPGPTNVSTFAMSGGTAWCSLSADGVVWCDHSKCCQSLCSPTDPANGPNGPLGSIRTFSKPVVQVSVGSFHYCALLSDGSVECAGFARSGELGTRDRTFCEDTAKPVPGLTGVVQIASGSNHTCALLASGAVRCWGLDDAGQLGIGFAYTNRISSGPAPGLSRPAYVRRGD